MSAAEPDPERDAGKPNGAAGPAGPFAERPRFHHIAVAVVGGNGDGVADHLLVTAVRNGKEHSAVLPA
jgi:hypothetical protein